MWRVSTILSSPIRENVKQMLDPTSWGCCSDNNKEAKAVRRLLQSVTVSDPTLTYLCTTGWSYTAFTSDTDQSNPESVTVFAE